MAVEVLSKKEAFQIHTLVLLCRNGKCLSSLQVQQTKAAARNNTWQIVEYPQHPCTLRILFGIAISHHRFDFGFEYSTPRSDCRHLDMCDVDDFMRDGRTYHDPHLVSAAEFYHTAIQAAVVWSAPSVVQGRHQILHQVRRQKMAVQFRSPACLRRSLVDNASNKPFGCRSDDPGELWPILGRKGICEVDLGICPSSAGHYPELSATTVSNFAPGSQITVRYTGLTTRRLRRNCFIDAVAYRRGRTDLPDDYADLWTCFGGLRYSTSNIIEVSCHGVGTIPRHQRSICCSQRTLDDSRLRS